MHAHAGCRTLTVPHDGADPEFAVLLLYPSIAPERAERVGPYALDVAMEGPAAEGRFPLVVVSHGTGGSHLLYRTVAAHLARAGFVVACPEHPGNNRREDSMAGTLELLERRPRDLRRTIDRLYADPELGPRLAPGAVAVVGHSLGGYTALALAGGRPVAVRPASADEPEAVCAVAVEPDPRVRALVLLAPATPWFRAPGALAEVRVPILLLTAERDAHTPAVHAEWVLGGVPDAGRVEHRVVPNAGHFSFLAPFPPPIANPGFAPSQDPPGFDRARFHAELGPEIEAFLRRAT